MTDEPLFTRPFVLCALSNLLQGIAFSLFLHFPGFLKGLGAEEVQIGLIASITAVASIASRPLIGGFMDTRGRRGVILLGNALNVTALVLYLGLGTIGPWLYLVRILHGLAEAMLFTALFTYAADCVPKARLTEGLAIFGVSGMLPLSLSGLLGDAILARADYSALFLTAVVFAVMAWALALPLRDVARAAGEHDDPPRGFWAALSQGDLIPLWWITTIFSIALASIFTFIKTFVMESGSGTVGGFFTSYTAVAIALRVFLGWLPDRMGPKRVLFPALVMLALGFLLLSQASSAREVALAGAFCGAGHGYTFPILFGLVINRSRDSERGSAMAIYTALFDVGLLAGGPGLGLVIELAGYPWMFATAGLLVMAGAISFGFWDRSRGGRG